MTTGKITYLRRALLTCALLAGMIWGGALWAQPTPDQQLFQQAQQALAQQRTESALEALEALEVDFRSTTSSSPNSPLAAQGSLMLFKLYREQGATQQAGEIWTRVFTRWPRTEYAWQLAEANYQYNARTDPEGALAKLEDAARGSYLPPDAPFRVQCLRLQYLQRAKPETFRAEVSALREAIPRAQTAEELRAPVELAGAIYQSLAANGQCVDARAMHEALQAALARLGNPHGWQAAEAQSYRRVVEPIIMSLFGLFKRAAAGGDRPPRKSGRP